MTLEPVTEFTLNPVKDEELMTGEVAKRCGVSADTIRHYERVGVIPRAARGANGYRFYPPEVVDRVMLVRRAVAIGFSLEELARILRQRDSGAAPCRGVRAMAGEKLAELDARIAEMMAMRDGLARIIDEWDDRLDATPDGARARLLETLKGPRS